ncbi:hypothetical protein Glove_114g153 [Diversispora epigaea]|uniref:Uncharacterized protein n=1 Tax=Diversispora epigaea TaxID=1348612 RepID=A0A397J7N5_9GLOM|nr:hypothetical protein Glove_114g153 [Diversispora epigaea]
MSSWLVPEVIHGSRYDYKSEIFRNTSPQIPPEENSNDDITDFKLDPPSSPGNLKEPKEDLKLFKAAADEGVPDAQLSYAVELIKFSNGDSKSNELILHHLVQATSGRNETAMYKLGDIFYNGKLGVKENKEMGIELYKLAAMMNHPGAMEFLGFY